MDCGFLLDAGGGPVSFAAVHVPEFPVVAWLRSEPACSTETLAVLEGGAPHERVVALNAAAKAAGVSHGMSKVQAETLGAGRFRMRRLAEEQEAFARLSEIAARFSPRVQDVRSPSKGYGADSGFSAALLLDRSGTETLFGSAASYARRLYRALHDGGFPASVATAPNADAALLLARSYPKVTCVEADGVEARLAPLPVSCLPCQDATFVLFERWGIRTLGELARLPEAALVSRVGQKAHRLQQLARGTAEHLLVPEEEAFTLCETMALDSPVEALESLLFVLSPLLERLLRKAMERAYSLRSVRLELQLERAEPHALHVRPAVPTQSRDLLLKLLHLELQAHPPSAGIVGVVLTADAAQPHTAQRGLFQAQFPEPGRLDLLLARLRAIAGEGNVGSPQLVNSHCDDAFAMAVFDPKQTNSAPDIQAQPNRVALRACRPPRPVRVTQWGNAPRTLFWDGARLPIERAFGPWHTSGGWWDDSAWNADEWEAVIAGTQQTVRLQQEHGAGAWFVVGVYD